MIIPPINTKGIFEFKEPFDKLLNSNQEYKVVSIRNILEMYNSEERPLDTVYKAVNLSQDDYVKDINNEVPIIVITDTANNSIYVPANRIASMPKTAGIEYQEMVVAINLGKLPTSYDLALAKKIIQDAIYSTIGIQSTAAVISTSAVELVADLDHSKYMKLIDNKKTITKSWETKYKELKEEYDSTIIQNSELTHALKVATSEDNTI